MRTTFPAALFLLAGCAASTHPVQRSGLGASSTTAAMKALLNEQGPIALETIVSSDWEADRKGLINLAHPTARDAGLVDGPEPIQIFFHVLRHPRHGLYIVDTGVERALGDDQSKSAMSSQVRSAKNLKKLTVHLPLGNWLAQQQEPLRGVFLTHLHLDHLTGMADVPPGTAVFAGPGETRSSSVQNLFTQASTNRALAGKAPISEWAYETDPSGGFSGVVDVFGDQSVFALWVPGHTPGTTAYLVRSTKGPVLLVGDACHTRWGTLHDSFAILDEAQNATVEQMKMVLTRLGSASKAVVPGDVTQIDLPPGKASGLVHARQALANIAGIGMVEFVEEDVMRHPLVQEVIRAWDKGGLLAG
jgi:glyoxylase-like metal-dependent hydrolase (beta-lactamase superfamily II)